MRNRLGAYAALLLALAVTTSACGGSGSSSSTPSPTATETVTASPTESATPTPTLSPTATTSAPTSTAPAAAPCRTANLTFTADEGEGAAGSVYTKIVMTNKGTASCSTGGYGGVSYVQGESNRVVGAPADRDSGVTATTFVLAPGEKAVATLQEGVAGNYPPAKCKPTDVDGLKVIPPNETHAAYVQHPTQGCASSSVHTLTLQPYKKS